MATSPLKFIGLTLGAVALGVLSASFAYGQMEPDRLQVVRDGAKGAMMEGTATQDEISRRMHHIVRR